MSSVFFWLCASLVLFSVLNANLIIFDHDGGVDDNQALLQLLQHQVSLPHSTAKHKLIAITTVHGNVDHDIVLNVSRSLIELMKPMASGHELDAINVFLGADSPLLSAPIPRRFAPHGHRGMGAFELPVHVNHSQQPQQQMHASLAILELIKMHHAQNKNEKIDIIAVGPLTNIALAIKLDAHTFSFVNSLWIMGGALYAQGNVAETRMSEYNFANDAEAAKIVFDHSHLVKTIIVPIDAMKRYPLSHIKPIMDSISKQRQTHFMKDMLSSVNYLWMEYLKERQFSPGWILPDFVTVIAYLFTEHVIQDMVEVHADIELCGTHSRGALAVDWINGIKTQHEFDALSDTEREEVDQKWWFSSLDCHLHSPSNGRVCIVEKMNHSFILQKFGEMAEFDCPHCFEFYGHHDHEEL